MCGIAGLFKLTGRPTAEDALAVVRMMEAQIHRGPDDWGLLIPESIAGDHEVQAVVGAGGREHVGVYPGPASASGAVLATRRLSVLDLSPRGRMPMGSRDGRLWITHNGEAYNYRELKGELGGSGSFTSETDTEVILRGYEAWGEDVLPRLCGMFAFAVFEAWPTPRLFLARDRLGIKPLYYYRDRERVVFASEVRALLRSGLIPGEGDADALVGFLQLGSVPLPRTTVKGVMAVPPGHSIVVDSRPFAARAYWQLSAHLKPRAALSETSVDDAAVATRALLDAATRLHLVSDAPLGVFLSGGIDSAALVALASRARPTPPVTLSIGFDEPAYTETRYARLVAHRHRTDHREIVLRHHDLFEGLPQFFAAMDEPTVDGVNTYFIAKAARAAGLTAVLSGIGGDEVFLGYEHLRRASALDRPSALFGKLPAWARRASIKAAQGALALASRNGREKLAYLAEPSGDNAYMVFRALFAPRQIQDLLGISARAFADASAGRSNGEASEARPLADRFIAWEFDRYLQSQLLKDADVMGMASGVEIRVPYLDHRLVEYVLGLPASWKLGDGPKPLLVKALGPDLPREIWDRPKMGFTFPFERWMRARADELRALSLDQTLLRPRAVETVWDAFRARRLHWSRPWALVVLAQLAAARAPRIRVPAPCPR